MTILHYLAGAFLILLLRCQAVRISSTQDAGLEAAAADQVYNSDASKNATERNSQNIPSLGRRMSKSQRKSPPPFLPGASNMLSQTFNVGQDPHNPQPLRMTAIPSNAAGPQPDRRHWPAPDAQRMSILSSAKSATEVGSDAAAPSKAKPYSAVGGYGFASQTPAPADFGTQRSQPQTLGSQNYNPYDGIDPTYEGNQNGGGHQGPSNNYIDYSKGEPYAHGQGAP
ncbi:hypothetical protein BJ912DRAFT_983015 [Pholiota molesta]|nr:hypothetical protein BJ912DRAFT_983015 [Pholiota molesta]